MAEPVWEWCLHPKIPKDIKKARVSDAVNTSLEALMEAYAAGLARPKDWKYLRHDGVYELRLSQRTDEYRLYFDRHEEGVQLLGLVFSRKKDDPDTRAIQEAQRRLAGWEYS